VGKKKGPEGRRKSLNLGITRRKGNPRGWAAERTVAGRAPINRATGEKEIKFPFSVNGHGPLKWNDFKGVDVLSRKGRGGGSKKQAKRGKENWARIS